MIVSIVLAVVFFWVTSGALTWLILSRKAQPRERWCCCGKFTLDDDDPLITAITIHEVHRCQPRREAIR